jgi:hypothetical protein
MYILQVFDLRGLRRMLTSEKQVFIGAELDTNQIRTGMSDRGEWIPLVLTFHKGE